MMDEPTIAPRFGACEATRIGVGIGANKAHAGERLAVEQRRGDGGDADQAEQGERGAGADEAGEMPWAA